MIQKRKSQIKRRNRLVLQAKINITARRNLKVRKKRKIKLKIQRRKNEMFRLQVQTKNKKPQRKVKRLKMNPYLVSIQKIKRLKSKIEENEKIKRKRSKKKKGGNHKNSCRFSKPLKRSMKIYMRTVNYQNGLMTLLNFTKMERRMKMSSLRITYKNMSSKI